MKVDTAFGTVETHDSDADLARAVADTVGAAQGVIDAIRGRPDGDCDQCGEPGRLRPIASHNPETDTYGLVHYCRPCQQAFAERQVEQLARQDLDDHRTDDDDPVAEAAEAEDA